MPIFADTSALYALLDSDDDRHIDAAAAFGGLSSERLVTHSYVAVETVALSHARLGVRVARRFLDDLLTAVDVQMVGAELHARAVEAFLVAGSTEVSLVDRVSFAFMRERGLTTAFAFDTDFRREGFVLAP